MERSIKIYPKVLLLVILCSTINFSAIAGGPWTQKKGKSYIKLSEWWVVFDQHFTNTGEIDPNITTGIFNTNLYTEYGFSDRFTGILNATLFSRNYMNDLVSGTTNEVIMKGEALNSLGDIDLSFKYRFTSDESKIPVAVSVTLGIPSGKTNEGTLENLQTGDGEFNQMIQVDAGRGYRISEKINGYSSVYLGVNNRTNDFSDELRFNAETGAGFLNGRLWMIARMTGVESFKNGATAEDVSTTSIFANNTEFLSVSLEGNYYITKKVGFSLSAAGALRAEIIAAAPSYSAGIFLDLSK